MNNRMPIGIDNFEKLVDKANDYRFIDKSLFIKEIIHEASEVILITRPRRWGKTLNMSMLKTFFSPSSTDSCVQSLFDDLAIAKVDNGRYMQYQGQSPVIFISLKDIKEDSFSTAIEKIRDLVRSIFEQHEEELLASNNLSDPDKLLIERYLSGDIDEALLQNSLFRLSRFFYKHYGNKRVYILIDEYDTPLNKAYLGGYLDEMSTFMRNFFSVALKSNQYLKKGVLTGILRISKNSMLSGLNNVEVASLLDKPYADCFGFTDKEVQQLFSDCQCNQSLDKVRAYYNGYQIGDYRLYNPWSIVNCLKRDGELGYYWVNSSDDRLLQDILLRCSLSAKEKLRQFFIDANVVLPLLLTETVHFDALQRDDAALWTLLFSAGYLTLGGEKKSGIDRECELRIPNHEVREVYLNTFKSWLRNEIDYDNYAEFMQLLVSAKVDEFTQRLERYLLTYGSCYDFPKESNYHTFMLGLFAGLVDYYEMHSNVGAGFGRADIMLVPKTDSSFAIILELKHDKSEPLSEALAVKALEQIDNQRYKDFLMRYQGIERVLKIGIAFGNRTAVSCYAWEDSMGRQINQPVSHRLEADE